MTDRWDGETDRKEKFEPIADLEPEILGRC